LLKRHTLPSLLQFKVSYYVIYYIEQAYHFKFQDYRRNGKVNMAERKQFGEHKYTYNVHDVCCNVQLILCWSVIGASWLDYCVGRCSLAPGDGEHCSRGICRYRRSSTAYRNYLHAGNSSKTNCNSSYYLLTYIVQDTIPRAKRAKRRGRTWEYFTVINGHTMLLVFFVVCFFIACLVWI